MANIITELHLEMSSNWYVSKKLNSVGRVGENTVTKLIIEPTEILDNVTYEIEIADASGSKNVAELTIDGTELYLILTANMLTVSGIMKMQVRGLFTDGSIKKSNIFELKVNRSISATEAYEEYAVTIFDQLVNECRDIIEGAESYAVRAETAAVNAEAYEQSASASADTATTAANTASTSATTATTAAETATAASTSAHTSAEIATTAANSASTSATTAQTSAQTAQSASVTAQSASETAQTASTAATSAQTAAETAANTATTAASNASASATAAANSATAASTSATSASASATSAVTSETNAAASAASASTAASNANTSATNAANSAVAAATSATNAHTSEVNASNSETNASTSAAEAEASAESIAASVAQISENTYRINDLEAIIGGYTQADLPTGAIATVTDGTALLMPNLKVGIEPVQDLHGYDHPWAGGAGANELNPDSIKATISAISGSSEGSDADGNYVIIPRNASINNVILYSDFTENTQYTIFFKVKPTGEIRTNIRVYYTDNTFDNIASSGDGVLEDSVYVTDASKSVSRIELGFWYLVTTKVYYDSWGIMQGSHTKSEFEPYSNICPISGWTAANVIVSPTTSAEDGTTYNIQFTDGTNPLTVYGGTLDVTSGELTVTDAHIASYDAETLPSTWISDRDVYAEGTTPTTGAEVVYKLANSVTYHLTPTQVRTLVGNNNIWADTGDIISGKYYKSLT